jgi:hypothetical protein
MQKEIGEYLYQLHKQWYRVIDPCAQVCENQATLKNFDCLVWD